MAENPQTSPRQIRSEPRGEHWVAWVSREDGKPDRSVVVVVGETQEEAEAHARVWAERSAKG